MRRMECSNRSKKLLARSALTTVAAGTQGFIMANAKELLDAGQLSAAIKELTQEVKSSPASLSSRVFLFELLCFAGEWDRAEMQLDVIGSEGVPAHLAVQAHLNNIKTERPAHQ